MASRFPSAWLDELRARSDIVQVISAYVPLKKSGRKYWGLCPFHGEKTASFSVDAEQQLYYCFGCKAGGTVITFVRDIEHCSFGEAVETLADRAHMPLPQQRVSDEEYERRQTRRRRLLEANRLAALFYNETLYKPEGAAALAYLKKRGLSDGVIRKFGLGAAPDDWTALTDLLQEKGFTLEELSSAGLSIVRTEEGGKTRAFDMFRNRAMFPIIDAEKNVIAFGGRSLGKQQPKYLNTSDSPVFNKRKGVYAANLLRRQRHLDRVILVEGYMDVVSLTQFGVEGVCATLGTALTEEQARLLSHYAPQVYLGYDGDSAGQHAILRGLDILESQGVPARVLDFPDGLDPDEFIRRDGLEGFNKLPAVSPAEYRLRRLKEGLDLSTDDGKLAYIRGAVPILGKLDPAERELNIRRLAMETGFPREIILESLDALPARPSDKPKPSRPFVRRGASDPPESDSAKAQEMLLGLLASGQIPKDLVEEKDFEEDELKSLYSGLVSGVSPASLIDDAPDEASRSRYTRILMFPQAESTDEMIAMANDCVSRIRKSRYEQRLKEITALLGAQPTPEERADLLREAQELTRLTR